MLAILIVVLVFSCTFVCCNDRLDGQLKGGFIAVVIVLIVVAGLLSYLLG